MANIAATDLSYSFNIKDKKRLSGSAGFSARGTITIGNNTLTYGGSGGVPLTKGKMGLPRFVRSLSVIGSDVNGLKYRFNYIPSTEKLMLLVSGVNIANAAANADANAAVWSNAGVISHGIAAVTGATGVVSGELGNVAITTSVIQVIAEGY